MRGKGKADKEFVIRNSKFVINEDEVFYYVYGFLHSEDWRKKWEITLRKEAARIEL